MFATQEKSSCYCNEAILLYKLQMTILTMTILTVTKQFYSDGDDNMMAMMVMTMMMQNTMQLAAQK